MEPEDSNEYSPEVRQRAVRMVLEHQDEHESQWAAINSIAAKIGCTASAYFAQAELDWQALLRRFKP